MADPLSTVAEQFVPTPASRSFFDPTEAGDIISRYATTNRVQAAARDELKDAIALERLDQSRQIWDRETLEYQDQQDFKANRGNLLESLASLDPEAEDYETQVSGFLATAPQVAAGDDAVQALLKVKQDRFGNIQRQRLQQADDLRREREAERRVGTQVQRTLAAQGFDPSPFIKQDTGDFDIDGALQAMAKRTEAKDVDSLRRKALEDREKEDAGYFAKDRPILDVVEEGSLPKAQALLEERITGNPFGPLPDELREKLSTDTEEAFISRVTSPIREKVKDPERITDVEKGAINTAEAVARSIYSANRGVEVLKRRTLPTAAPTTPAKSNPWLDNALRKVRGNE